MDSEQLGDLIIGSYFPIPGIDLYISDFFSAILDVMIDDIKILLSVLADIS
jgi:hypothetical protein